MIKIQPVSTWKDGIIETGNLFYTTKGEYNFSDGSLNVEYVIVNISRGSVIVPVEIVNSWTDDTMIIDYVMNKLGLIEDLS